MENRKPLFKIGSVSLLLAGVILLAVAALSILIGGKPGANEEYLRSVSEHTRLSMVNFAIYSLADVLLLVGAIAIFFAVKTKAENLALVGTAIFVFFIILDLAITETNSMALVMLLTQYEAATTVLQKSQYMSAALYALSTLPIGTFLSYTGSSIGLLLITFSMRKKGFNRITFFAGLIASVEGIVGGFYVFIPGLAVFLTPCLVAFGLWALLSGTGLFRLSKG